MAKRANQKIDVTIKPWWQTQLFAALVAGAIGLTPWLYSLYQDSRKKSEKEEIVADNIGMTFLYTPLDNTTFSFNKTNGGLLDVRMQGGTYGKQTAWIMLNRGDEKVEMARGQHDGVFYGVARGLSCNTTYTYRTEGLFKSRTAYGPVSRFSTPKCRTEQERSKAQADAHFVDEI